MNATATTETDVRIRATLLGPAQAAADVLLEPCNDVLCRLNHYESAEAAFCDLSNQEGLEVIALAIARHHERIGDPRVEITAVVRDEEPARVEISLPLAAPAPGGLSVNLTASGVVPRLWGGGLARAATIANDVEVLYQRLLNEADERGIA